MKSYKSIVPSLTDLENFSDLALEEVEDWPQTLKTTLNICFSSPGAMMVLWGEEFHLFYNNAWQDLISIHGSPEMGKPAMWFFNEKWQKIKPVLLEIMETNHPRIVEGAAFSLNQDNSAANGFRAVKLVPLQAETGEAGGIVVFPVSINKEDTGNTSALRNHNMLIRERSQLVLQQILKINTAGILFFDIEGKFIDANDTFLRMTGYTRTDLEKGILSSELVTLPEWMPRTREVFKELKTADYFSPYEKELIRPDGSRWWGLFAGTRIRENEFVEFVLDITEKKNGEIALSQAKESAEKALYAKDEFLSVMSHEMRTPLSAIVGITNLLLNKEPRADQIKNLNALKISSRNLLNLINDILDFSKAEAGMMDLQPVEFYFGDFLSEQKKIHQINADEKGLRLEVITDDNIPRQVITDRSKLFRVLDNLLNNAIKFTDNGQVTLKVDCAGREGQTTWLEFSVSDTGIGIPEEKLPHIFEKFTQADSSTTRKYGGTGLGLSITKKLLEILNSEILVESIAGKGSRFWFKLPVTAGKQKPVSSESIQEVDNRKAIDAKILIAEDVDINRMIISQYINDWCEKEPDEAENGKEAVEMVRNNNYDVILMDVRMPEMNGFEATRLIKSINRSKHVPVIALTANIYHDIRKNPDFAVFDDVVTKPFEPEDLRNTILKHVLNKSIHKAATLQERNNSGSTDFQMIENQFKGNEENLQKFYKSTLKHLVNYELEFRQALLEQDLGKFRNLQHNITMLINLFRLDELDMLLKNTRKLFDEHSFAGLADMLAQGEIIFNRIMQDVQKQVDSD